MSEVSAVVGAGYIDAVLTGATDLTLDYRRAFAADELLDALSAPLRTIGQFLAAQASCTVTEACDALVNAYTHLLQCPPPTPHPPGDVLL